MMKPDAPPCIKCGRYSWGKPNGARREDHYCLVKIRNDYSEITGETDKVQVMARCEGVRGTERCEHIMPKIKVPKIPKVSFWGIVNKLTGGKDDNQIDS